MKSLICLLAIAGSLFAQLARPQRTVFSTAAQTSGTGDAIVLAPSPALSALTDLDTTPPMQVCFVAESANTTTTTVQISGLTAKSLYKLNGAINTALAANDIRVGQFVCFIRYPTGDAFQMTTPLGNAPSGGGQVFNFDLVLVTKDSGATLTKVSTTLSIGAGSAGDPFHYLTFPDGNTTHMTYATLLPAHFVSAGALTIKLAGKSASASDYVLEASAVCVGPGEAVDTTNFSVWTAASATTFSTTNLTVMTISAVPTTGCAAGENFALRIRRGTDTPSDGLSISTISVTQ